MQKFLVSYDINGDGPESWISPWKEKKFMPNAKHDVLFSSFYIIIHDIVIFYLRILGIDIIQQIADALQKVYD